MKKIDAIIVDGVVYDVVKSNGITVCKGCDFYIDGDCLLSIDCPASIEDDQIFKRRETKDEQ